MAWYTLGDKRPMLLNASSFSQVVLSPAEGSRTTFGHFFFRIDTIRNNTKRINNCALVTLQSSAGISFGPIGTDKRKLGWRLMSAVRDIRINTRRITT